MSFRYPQRNLPKYISKYVPICLLIIPSNIFEATGSMYTLYHYFLLNVFTLAISMEKLFLVPEMTRNGGKGYGLFIACLFLLIYFFHQIIETTSNGKKKFYNLLLYFPTIFFFLKTRHNWIKTQKITQLQMISITN